MTTTTAPVSEMILVDPASLADHPDNVRSSTADVKALAASIREVGILEPLVAARDEEGQLVLIAGHRRKAAAIEAGLTEVPVVVRDDLAGQLDAIGGMIVENTQRAGLSAAESAAAFQKMLDLGASAGRVGKLAGMKATEVKRHQVLATSEATHAIAARHNLTLDQALILAEFEGDREALKDLAVTAVKEPERLEHRASQIRHQREREAKIAASTAAAEAAGLELVERLSYDVKLSEPCRIRDLCHPDGRALDDGEADCAAISYDGELVLGVMNPKERKLRKRGYDGKPAGGGGKRTEEEKAQMRATIANNKAWPPASEVRRAFVAGLAKRRTPPKNMAAFVLRTAICDPRLTNDADTALIAEWLGVEIERGGYGPSPLVELAGASEARLVVAAFTQLASAIEYRVRNKDGWRTGPSCFGEYLSLLVEWGYTPAEVEEPLIAAKAKAKAKAA